MTRIGDTFSLYLDADFEDNDTSVGLTVDQRDTWIGVADDGAGRPIIDYNGLIDEAAIWGRGLQPEEITALYNDGEGLAYPFPTPKPTVRKQAIFESNIRA